ncbi:MAG: T9SS type A sorting domain-containing protein [Bacteroidota bacterium]|nr:T9SS type A sorting domain-containing protein [Bacteroidota bacterium]
MKYFATLVLLLSLWSIAAAQVDTLHYDELDDIDDGQLVAVTRFPGELDVVFNARFTPAEKCTLHTVLVAFSVVKFQALTGHDTLVVMVYENGSVPPSLVNLQKTYKVDLGDAGFPSPNIRFDHPLEAGARDVLAVKLDPPVLFSPRREFIVGVKLISDQRYAVGLGTWNGFSVLINPGVAEYERYRRYHISPNEQGSRNMLATEGANAGLFIRPIVSYNPDMPPIDPVDVEAVPAPQTVTLEANYPNPFNPATTLAFTLGSAQRVSLAVYDALGRRVAVLAEGMQGAGRHQLRFDGAGLPGGLYTARLTVDGRTLTRKMLLMK